MFLGLYENLSKTVLGEASSGITYCITRSFFRNVTEKERLYENVFRIVGESIQNHIRRNYDLKNEVIVDVTDCLPLPKISIREMNKFILSLKARTYAYLFI
jgi:hypothetical protein